MENMNKKNNAAVTLDNLEKLDREIDVAYNRACIDKNEQINRARLNKDEFKMYSGMASKRANEFSASVEELAKLKSTVLKKKVQFLKQQVTPAPQPQAELKVEQPITKEDLEKAKNGGFGAGFWVGGLVAGGLALYAMHKTKKHHKEEVDRLYNRINELEKNQK